MKIKISVLVAVGCLCLIGGCDKPAEYRGAWTIVKQSSHENYGFVTELGWGFVVAGYANKEMAEAAMKEARWHYRHPPNRAPKQSLWEAQ